MSRLGASEYLFFQILFGPPILAAALFIIVLIIFLITDRESPKKIKRMDAARGFGIIAGVMNLSMLVMLFVILAPFDMGLGILLFGIPLMTAAVFIISLIIFKRTDKTSPKRRGRKILATVFGVIAGTLVFAVNTIFGLSLF